MQLSLSPLPSLLRTHQPAVTCVPGCPVIGRQLYPSSRGGAGSHCGHTAELLSVAPVVSRNVPSTPAGCSLYPLKVGSEHGGCKRHTRQLWAVIMLQNKHLPSPVASSSGPSSWLTILWSQWWLHFRLQVKVSLAPGGSCSGTSGLPGLVAEPWGARQSTGRVRAGLTSPSPMAKPATLALLGGRCKATPQRAHW